MTENNIKVYAAEMPEFENTTENENTKNARANEFALIGATLRDGSNYERAREIVKPEHFDWTCYAWVWEACERLYSQGLHIDTITVGDELRRSGHFDDFSNSQDSTHTIRHTGMAAIMYMRESGDPRNMMTYAENVRDYSNKRKILQFLNKGAGWAMNGRRSKDIIADLMTEFSTIEVVGAGDEYTHPIADGVSEAYDWVMNAAQGKLIGVQTGLIELDMILKHLFAKNLYIIAARPKQGKTGLLASIAIFVSLVLGKRVLWYSLEMSKMQVSLRLISQVSGIDLSQLFEGKLSDEEWVKFNRASEIVHKLPIIINDLSSIDVTNIRQIARKEKAANGVDLIIVDYLQLAGAEAGQSYDRRDLEVGAISRGLKHLAGELDVPVLAAAQLSRRVEERADKRPMLSDLRESGSIEQDADGVAFIYRAEYYENGARPGEADIIVAAQRNGPTGTAVVQFQASTVKFRNLDNRHYEPQPWQSRADVGDD